MKEDTDRRAKQALILWGVYIALTILFNGTIPFVLGRDMQAWTASSTRDVLVNFIVYGLIFLVIPLILIKGWQTVRQPDFLLPLTLAILVMTLRTSFRPVAAIAVLVLAGLHYRHDLTEFGFRSRGWRGDVVAIILIALLSGARRLLNSEPFSLHPIDALLAGLDRGENLIQSIFPTAQVPGGWMWGLAWLIFLTLGPYSQIYRYLKVSTPTERLQTRWVVFGFFTMGGFVISGALFTQIGLLPAVVLSDFYFGLGALLLPLTIGVSVLRYRLWDIDVIIRRTLVYAVLTATLALVFFGGVALLQNAFSSLTGTENSPVAIVLSTLAIARLINPLRRWLQDFNDRRFYRRKYDAGQILEQFALTARNETDLNALTAELVRVAPHRFYTQIPGNMKAAKLFLFLLIALSALNACQNEAEEIKIPLPAQAFNKNSPITNLISRTTLRDGSVDNILDSGSCVSLVLTVTVSVNGQVSIVNTVDDLKFIERIVDESEIDEDEISIEFPVAIVFDDYSQLVIQSEDELESLTDQCMEGGSDDDIECVDFVYPVKLVAYNVNNQVSEIITIDHDETLHDFIDTMEDGGPRSLRSPWLRCCASASQAAPAARFGRSGPTRHSPKARSRGRACWSCAMRAC